MSTSEHVEHLEHAEHLEPWWERHWSWLVIGFGLVFVACLDFFVPTI